MTTTTTHDTFREAAYAHFSKRDSAFLSNPEQFNDFMASASDAAAMQSIVNTKQTNFSSEQRALLTSELTDLYTEIGIEPPRAVAQLQADNTFLIVTAHQPCIFTGPLYFIYKIASVIALSRQLSAKYPSYNFLAMYVVGSEDHDYDEIKSANIFNKKITWETAQTGAVGRMKLKDIETALDQIEEMISAEPYGLELISKLRASYRSDYTLAQATLHFVHTLFNEDDLLVCDLDRPSLKEAAKHIFEKELNEQFSQPLVEENQRHLNSLGFEPQVYTRDINLFWLDDMQRNRIESSSTEFRTTDGKVVLPRPAALDHNSAYCVSPNVILRPVYQQAVLPAVAYVGGGAEVAYWMEIKGVFDSVNVPCPMLVRRDSAFWISQSVFKQLERINLSINDIFRQKREVQEAYLLANSDENWSLDGIKTSYEEIFNQLKAETTAIDNGLEKMLGGFQQQQNNFIDKLEGRLKKSIKSKHDTAMNRIDKVWHSLFPNDSLQERKVNFIPIYARHGQQFIEELINNFDPLSRSIHVFTEKETE